MGLGEVVNTDRRIASRTVGGRKVARSLLRLGQGELVAPPAWEVRSIVQGWEFALVLVGPGDDHSAETEVSQVAGHELRDDGSIVELTFSTRMVFPPRSVPLRPAMAASASSVVFMVTKANPRDSCE
jgi:hypothetical protein